jgi:L-arabinokinase
MHIVYYITSHGFGHGVRSCAICNQFKSGLRLTIRSALPKSFFDEELCRPFEYFGDQLDCGCAQVDGVTVDIVETAKKYTAIARANTSRLQEQIAWTVNNAVDCVVSDITPFAFEVAAGAGVASVAVSNFSWLDIYEPYASVVPSFAPAISHIRRQYGMAGLLLALAPPCELRGFVNRRDMSVVGRNGCDQRERLRAHFGVDAGKAIGLIYMGEYGLEQASWKQLERFHGWQFIGIHSLTSPPSNYLRINKMDFRYEDLSASVDCIIAKLGYGVCSESLLNGVPVVFLPRTNFVEYPVLERFMFEHGLGYRLSRDDFLSCAWDEPLRLIRGKNRPARMVCDGAIACAEAIERFSA